MGRTRNSSIYSSISSSNDTCVDSSIFPTTAILARASHNLRAYPSSRTQVSVVVFVVLVAVDEIVLSAETGNCGDDIDAVANK